MKRLGRAFLIGIFCMMSGAAVAIGLGDAFQWIPKTFEIGANPFSETLIAMKVEKDPVLMDILKVEPNFIETFSGEFNHFLSFAVNSIVFPWDLMNVDKKGQPDFNEMSHSIGKPIKNVEIYAAERSIDKIFKTPNQTQPYSYRYCELHPEAAQEWPCSRAVDTGDGNYNHSFHKPAYVLVRRLLSNASLVDRMCPTVTTWATWYMNWSWSPENQTVAQKSKFFRRFFAELDRALQFIYNDGVWDHRHLLNEQGHLALETKLDPNLVHQMKRRYLDGGPKVIQSYRNCLGQLETAFASQVESADPYSSLHIDELLGFEFLSNEKLSVADTSISPETLYRLTHFYSYDDLPEGLSALMKDYYGAPAGVYLQTIAGVDTYDSYYGMSQHRLLSVLKYLSTIDPVYNYHPMTFNEYLSIKNSKSYDFTKKSSYCFFTKKLSQITKTKDLEYYLYNPDTNEITPGTEWDCYAETLLLVREAEVSPSQPQQ